MINSLSVTKFETVEAVTERTTKVLNKLEATSNLILNSDNLAWRSVYIKEYIECDKNANAKFNKENLYSTNPVNS